jgi:hypothetical protein
MVSAMCSADSNDNLKDYITILIMDNIIQLTPEQEAKIKEQFNKPVEIPKDIETGITTEQQDMVVVLAKATAHIIAIERNMENFRGKANMNPYAWLREKNISKLKNLVARGDVNAALTVLKISSVEEPRIKNFEYLTEDAGEEKE